MNAEKQEIQTRTTVCCGESIVIYSGDGWRWFSEKHQAARAQAEHEKFITFMQQSLKRSATFMVHAPKPRGPNRLQREAAARRQQVAELKAQGLSNEEIAKRMWPDEFQKMASMDGGAGRMAKRVYSYLRTAAEPTQVAQQEQS